MKAVSVALAALFCATLCAAAPRPTVLWHGMGDSCCDPLSMGYIKAEIEKNIPGIYVHSIMIGASIESDMIQGFLSNVNDQVQEVCLKLKNETALSGGFNAVGFSQGSQFLRAYIERCNDPPVFNYISMGGQHVGVADIPDCVNVDAKICKVVQDLLAVGAYDKTVQHSVVQAQYFHDQMIPLLYEELNTFLPDINNMHIVKNAEYKKRLTSLNKMVLTLWLNDTVVVPRESEHFGYFRDASRTEKYTLEESPLYTEDWIGLRALDEAGRLVKYSILGEHMQVDMSWFVPNIIQQYLNNELPTESVVDIN